MRYYNRLSGEERNDLSGILLAGLWQVQESNDYVFPQDEQNPLQPDELEAHSIRLLGKILQTNDNNWLDWCDISPLVPDISEKIEMQPLEQFLLSEEALHLHHLQQVCAMPRTHLQTETERVPVARATPRG